MPISSQQARFGIVGAFNTALDFILLFTLTASGIGVVAANVISTSTSFVFSFFANKNFTFRTTTGSIRRQVVLFTIFTLFGLWFIQGAVIDIAYPLLNDFTTASTSLFLSKLIATLFSLAWNYVTYSRVVFKRTDSSK